MKKLISMTAAAAALLAGPALADYPLSGSISTGVAANVAQFSDVGKPDPGFTRGTLSASVSYAPIEPLTLTGSMALFKNLDPGQAGEGTVGATTYGKTQIQDVGLDANWAIGKLGPAAFSSGVTFSVPLSENSQAIGLVTTIAPRVGVAIELPATLSLTLGANAGLNVLENPTVRIDCTEARFRDVCAVSGSDTGNPNQRWNYGASVGLSAKPLAGLGLSANYSIGAGIGAVSFPRDEFTPQVDGIQNGTQYTAASHATTFAISYSLSGLLPEKEPVVGEARPGARTPEGAVGVSTPANPGGAADVTPDIPESKPAWAGFSFSLSLSTRDLVYARDREDNGDAPITVPVYDFETPQRSRSLWTFAITYAI